MRDDIRSIIDKTSLALERKITLLNQFLTREHELDSCLKTDFENEPLLILESVNDLIGLINIEDYTISGLCDEFRLKTGKNLFSPGVAQFADEDGRLGSLIRLQAESRRIAGEISALRETNIRIMETLKKEIRGDAEQLRRMMDLDFSQPKESQSSC